MKGNNLEPLRDYFRAAGFSAVASGDTEGVRPPCIRLTESTELLHRTLHAWENDLTISIEYDTGSLDFPAQVRALLDLYVPVAGTDRLEIQAFPIEPDNTLNAQSLQLEIKEFIQIQR